MSEETLVPNTDDADVGTILRRHTSARVALGRTGPAIPTAEHLRFQLDHALARDAVNAEMDVARLLLGLLNRGLEAIALKSAAYGELGRPARRTYLRRPDLGRQLIEASAQALRGRFSSASTEVHLVFVIADGLSALAVERHALALLDATLSALDLEAWRLGPVCVVSQGRVAVGDEVGSLLGARATVMLIGERPGLSSPDSLGVYLTWDPGPGRCDADRNCISNVRLEGLSYAAAAERIVFYLEQSRRLGRTGVELRWTAKPEEIGTRMRDG